MRHCLLTAILVWFFPGPGAFAEEKAVEPGAPTATLFYTAEESVVFYNEVKVIRSAPSSYFSVCGWQSGYFGMQELKDGKKVIIFSVWDSDHDDPAALPEAERTKTVNLGHRVRTGRFGNEGSGSQSFLDYDWKDGVTYSFVVTAKKNKKRMEYSAFFRAPGMETWHFIATFSTLYSPRHLTSLYSFIEDFERSPASAQKLRSAVFSNGWVQLKGGSLKPLNEGEFCSDRPSVFLDARTLSNGFQMLTGGDTKNRNKAPNSVLRSGVKAEARPPVYFP